MTIGITPTFRGESDPGIQAIWFMEHLFGRIVVTVMTVICKLVENTFRGHRQKVKLPSSNAEKKHGLKIRCENAESDCGAALSVEIKRGESMRTETAK